MEIYLGEIRLFSFDWAPQQWALCNGALLPIKQNAALFALLRTQFGGDGRITFGLPDLRGRVPIGAINNGAIGQMAGRETVTLTTDQMPSHNHFFGTNTGLGVAAEPNDILATPSDATKPTVDVVYPYTPSAVLTRTLNEGTIAANGGNGPHNNMQPFNTVNYCIALVGIFPSRP